MLRTKVNLIAELEPNHENSKVRSFEIIMLYNSVVWALRTETDVASMTIKTYSNETEKRIISGHFFANCMNIIHKTEVQMIILRCFMGLNLNTQYPTDSYFVYILKMEYG